jgi:hypothetical protein
MDTLLIKELNNSRKKRELISVYDDKEDITNFYIGYIVEVFSNSILILSLDEFEQEDGYVLIRFADIFKIEKDSIYLDKVSSIIKTKKIPELKFKLFRKDELLENGIDAVIAKCQKEKRLLSIKLIYMDYITGFIKKYDDDFIILEAYRNTGKDNGTVIIKYEDIQSLAFDRSEELSCLSLIEKNNN